MLFNINKDILAGPDGFSYAFYHSCSEPIAKDIEYADKNFFSGTPVPRSFTATIITLIPKTEAPHTWNDFRPISLCKVVNKILPELLYNKITGSVPNLISPS
ncbi:UNVERIFIED_CONTAM: hypothetical protein Sangu_3092400 [Sesamum angustifolium]|uniref:Reverse transcriptase n=1 Tax=Sesamum angustifolium TaxID=2727405 RepID=A0AAW2K807_9LAMI